MCLAFPIPRVPFSTNQFPVDQQGLDHLTTCQRLTSVIISGDAFSSVIFPADGFNTVTSLTIQSGFFSPF